MKRVQVLGPGCAKCKELAQRTEEAVAALGLACEVEKVTEIQQIMLAGVMMTPALVVDGTVKVTGKVPSVEQIKQMLA